MIIACDGKIGHCKITAIDTDDYNTVIVKIFHDELGEFVVNGEILSHNGKIQEYINRCEGK